MSTEPINLTVSRQIQAPADQLWAMVSDITRMGEWSPETTGAEWLGAVDGPQVGARFKGTNTAGPNTWSTKPTVTAAEPGRSFEFKVPGRSGPTWRYEFEPQPDGSTVVTESIAQERRSPLFIRLLQKRAGITDRRADLQHNLEATLANLATAAVA